MDRPYVGPILEALILKLQGEIAVAKANIDVYKKNPAGIGEHPDIVEAVETQVTKIAEAQDKIDTIIKLDNL
jgi:hypothetical protein|tara:strand:+ start:9486 stop:9701 length:216 start_codon:yes stop_codon:yes gene_type:complete